MTSTEGDTTPEAAAKPTPRPRTAAKPSPRPRTGDERRTEAEPEEPRTEPTRRQRRRRARPSRRAVTLASLAVIVVLLAAAATWFGLESNRLRDGNPEENTALVDSQATADVTKQVSQALESIFSYNYTSLGRTQRAADRVLLDAALKQYNAKFAKARKAVEESKVVRTTSVREIGVRSLRGDTARVLVFLDQQTLTSGGKSRGHHTAYLDVVAKKAGGTWKIAQLGTG